MLLSSLLHVHTVMYVLPVLPSRPYCDYVSAGLQVSCTSDSGKMSSKSSGGGAVGRRRRGDTCWSRRRGHRRRQKVKLAVAVVVIVVLFILQY